VWKERYHGTTKNRHIGHCTHTAEITNVKVQKVYHGKYKNAENNRLLVDIGWDTGGVPSIVWKI